MRVSAVRLVGLFASICVLGCIGGITSCDDDEFDPDNVFTPSFAGGVERLELRPGDSFTFRVDCEGRGPNSLGFPAGSVLAETISVDCASEVTTSIRSTAPPGDHDLLGEPDWDFNAGRLIVHPLRLRVLSPDGSAPTPVIEVTPGLHVPATDSADLTLSLPMQADRALTYDLTDFGVALPADTLVIPQGQSSATLMVDPVGAGLVGVGVLGNGFEGEFWDVRVESFRSVTGAWVGTSPNRDLRIDLSIDRVVDDGGVVWTSSLEASGQVALDSETQAFLAMLSLEGPSAGGFVFEPTFDGSAQRWELIPGAVESEFLDVQVNVFDASGQLEFAETMRFVPE